MVHIKSTMNKKITSKNWDSHISMGEGAVLPDLCNIESVSLSETGDGKDSRN
jgi:hypothetical protein